MRSVFISLLFLALTGDTLKARVPTPGKPVSPLKKKGKSPLITTLEEALAEAYGWNPDILDARIQVDKASETVTGTLYDQWAPEIRPTLSYSGQSGTGSVTQKSSSLGVSGKVNLFKGGGSIFALKKGKLGHAIALLAYKSKEQEVFFQIVQCIAELIANQEKLKAAMQTQASLARAVEQRQAQLQAGEAVQTDVAAADAQLREAEAKVSQAQCDIETQKAAFVALVGRAPGNFQMPAVPRELPQTLEALSRLSEKNYFSFQIAALKRENAEYGVRAARADALSPSVDLSAEIGSARAHSSAIDAVGRRENRSVTLSVSVPFSAVRHSAARQAEHDLTLARIAHEKGRRDLRNAVVKTWQQFLVAGKHVEQYQAQVSAASLALESGRAELELGLKTPLDVLDLEKRLLDAKYALAEAHKGFLLSKFQILSLCGMLTVENFKLLAVKTGVKNYSGGYLGAPFGFGVSQDPYASGKEES